ncbi:hypothetical protein H0H87_010209 [Tephrocybe sp. NHM501043]|nr:hypothetical protein H0H87_010209 [Tephrocybe sp. NHM501043]
MVEVEDVFNSKASILNEVIEITSDEDETLGDLDDPFLPVPGSCRTSQQSSDNKEPVVDDGRSDEQVSGTKAIPRKFYRAPRRVIESSDSEDADAERKVPHVSEIIELSNSSPERSIAVQITPKRRNIAAKAPVQSENELFASDESDDEAILTLNEPKSARRPLQLPILAKTSPSPVKPLQDLKKTSEKLQALDANYTVQKITPSRRKTPVTTQSSHVTTAITARTTSSKPHGTPRISKKAQAEAEQERRVLYAQQLFQELNHSVFDDKLPKETKLIWSKRLLTTAGRAKWHSYGRHSKSIDVNKVGTYPLPCTVGNGVDDVPAVCGACREGRLTALFKTRPSRMPKTPKTSRQAATRPQDSPQPLPSLSGDAVPSSRFNSITYTIHDSDSESDAGINTLTTAMGLVDFID